MKIEKERKDMEVYGYLYEVGLRIIEEQVKEDNYIADYVGYEITDENNLKPLVVVEVKTKENMDFKAQQQMFKTAKKFNVPYALLILFNNGNIEKHWFNAKTSLPIGEPYFEKYENYMEEAKEIQMQIWKIYDLFRNQLDPYEIYEVIITGILGKRYLDDIGHPDDWIGISFNDMWALIRDAKNYFDIDEERNIYKKLDFRDVAQYLSALFEPLPPFSKQYINVFADLIYTIEKENNVGIAGVNTQLKNIFTELISPLYNQQDSIIDITNGMGFTLLNIANKTNMNKYVGVEIDPKISFYSKVLSKIACNKEVLIKNYDSIKLDIKDEYDFVIAQPPLIAKFNKDEYSNYNLGKKKARSEELFIEQSLNLLNPGGYTLILTSESVLFSNKNQKLRDYILDTSIVKGIFSLAPGIYANTNVRLSILVLKKRESKDNTPQEVFVSEIDDFKKPYDVLHKFENWIKESEK